MYYAIFINLRVLSNLFALINLIYSQYLFRQILIFADNRIISNLITNNIMTILVKYCAFNF